MKKRFFALFVGMIMLFGLAPGLPASAAKVGVVNDHFDGIADKEVTISKELNTPTTDEALPGWSFFHYQKSDNADPIASVVSVKDGKLRIEDKDEKGYRVQLDRTFSPITGVFTAEWDFNIQTSHLASPNTWSRQKLVGKTQDGQEVEFLNIVQKQIAVSPATVKTATLSIEISGTENIVLINNFTVPKALKMKVAGDTTTHKYTVYLNGIAVSGATDLDMNASVVSVNGFRLQTAHTMIADLDNLVISSGEDDPEPPMSGLDVYLCIGQSNMYGQGEMPVGVRSSLPNVYLMDNAGGWTEELIDSNGYGISRYSNGKMTNGNVSKPLKTHNLTYSFAQAITEANPDKKIGLIVNPASGTGLDLWMPDKTGEAGDAPNNYARLLAKAKKAKEDGNAIKGILWHQGESDAGAALRATYLERLNTMITQLRTDLGLPDLPLVVGEVLTDRGETSENSIAMNEVLNQAPAKITNSAVVKGADLLANSPDDSAHFDAASLDILGTRYADKINQMVYGAELEPPEGLDLYLVYGQSNSIGYAPFPSPFPSERVDGVYLYTGAGFTEKLFDESKKLGMGRFSTSAGPSDTATEWGGRYGFTYNMVKELRKTNPDRKIGLVVNGRGGIMIENLMPGAAKDNYVKTIDRLKRAMRKNTLKGIIWHHGEANDSPARRETYLASFKTLVANLREDLGMPDLPVIAGEIHDERTNKEGYTEAMNAILNSIPEHVTNAAVAEAHDLSVSADDLVHFTPEGADILGSRYAALIEEKIYNAPPAPDYVFTEDFEQPDALDSWTFTQTEGKEADLIYGLADGALQLVDTVNGGSLSAARPIPTLTGQFRVELDLNETVYTAAPWSGILLRGSTASGEADVLKLTSRQDQATGRDPAFRYDLKSGDETLTPLLYKPRVGYMHIAIEGDVKTQKLDIWINGVRMAKDVLFLNDVTSVGKIQLYTGSGPVTTMAADNIKVYDFAEKEFSILNVSAENGTVSFDLKNNTASAVAATVIVAEYQGASLRDCKAEEITVATGTTSKSVTFDAPAAETEYKVFLWAGSLTGSPSLIPLAVNKSVR